MDSCKLPPDQKCTTQPGSASKSSLCDSPPSYPDLGKRAADLFEKGYHFGLIKLNCNSRSQTGVEFIAGGESDNETREVFGNFETKYTSQKHGMRFFEKWNTNRNLSMGLFSRDNFLKGVELGAVLTFFTEKGGKALGLRSGFNNEWISLQMDADLESEGTTIKGAVVAGYQGFFAGGQLAIDAGNGEITKTNFAFDFCREKTHLHGHVNDGEEFTASVYHKISSRWEGGIQYTWLKSSKESKFGIGAIYEFDTDTSFRAKVFNDGQVGLGLQQRLHPGISLCLSMLINSKNSEEGGHKYGIALEFEA